MVSSASRSRRPGSAIASVKVIGLGGIGAPLAQAMAQFLAHRRLCDTLWLVDGDRYDAGNTRVLFEAYDNKAEAKARELTRATAGRLAIRAVPEFVTPRNARRILTEGDCVLLAVDNHASRKLVINACRRLKNVVLISGGNDGVEADKGRSGTCGNVQVYVRRRGRELTNCPTRFHPELAHPRDQRPDQRGCEALAPATPQLLFTNLSVAAAMLGTFHAWLTRTLAWEELYLDIARGSMVPVRRVLERRSSGRAARLLEVPS